MALLKSRFHDFESDLNKYHVTISECVYICSYTVGLAYVYVRVCVYIYIYI